MYKLFLDQISPSRTGPGDTNLPGQLRKIELVTQENGQVVADQCTGTTLRDKMQREVGGEFGTRGHMYTHG